MRTWVKVVIVLSSYFGILQSAQAGVYLRLKGRTNFTGGIVPIQVIGVTTSQFSHSDLAADEYENNGLQCVTDKPNCCRVAEYGIRIGEWFFPDGTRVPIRGLAYTRGNTFFRNRGDNDGTVNLNRVSSDIISPTGNFCCQAPDSMDRNQTVCANITSITITIVPLGTRVAGENFALQCSVEGAGDFLTQIKWLIQSGRTEGTNVETDGSRTRLQFTRLSSSHSGVHTCQATVGDKNFTESYTLPVNPIMAPSSPQNFRAVSYTTTASFSWNTPLHPRALANYTLTCVSLSEEVGPLIMMVYAEAGNYSLGGFRPATMYNCSTVATNSIGNSTPSHIINITTADESSQLLLWLMKIDNCSKWTVTDAGQKLNNISSAILDSVENRCHCGFIQDRITDQAFQCIDNTPEAVVYVATIHGTASVNSSVLISYIEQWATDDAIVTTSHEVLNISTVDPGTTGGEFCNEMTEATEVTTSNKHN